MEGVKLEKEVKNSPQLPAVDSKESTPKSSKSNVKENQLESEIRQLKAQCKGMEVLLDQNAALEKEVKRLCEEINQLTMGIEKRGFLYKWREREIFYAPKWGLRYFVLQGNKLSYYGDEQERRPRRTIELSKCFVREEGLKKQGLYHVFAIYLASDVGDANEETLLLRLSSDNAVEAQLWVEMLNQACNMNVEVDNSDESPRGDIPETPKDAPHFKHPTVASELNTSENTKLSLETVGLESPDVKEELSPIMLKRVLSSNQALQEAAVTKVGLSRRNIGKLNHTISGTEISTQADVKGKEFVSPNTKKSRAKDAIMKFKGYRPMHIHAAPSPLSNEVRPGEYSFRGFFNLSCIIMILTHCDLIVNNMNKYGFKLNITSFIRPPEAMIISGDISFETKSLVLHFTKSIGSWVISILLSYYLEKYAAKHNVSEKWMRFINGFLASMNIIVPCYWVWTSHAHPFANLIYLFESTIIWLKLISYAHANKDLRIAYKKPKKIEREISNSSVDEMAFADSNSKPEQYIKTVSEVKNLEPPFLLYPMNLTLKNLLWFLLAPTLCYQLNYPRTPQRSFKKMLSLVARMLFVSLVIIFSVEQYIKPTLEGAIAPMHDGNILGMIERLLKLSIPNTYVWLLGFYLYFHLWLNFLAEITRFGDRVFYKDWWNAKTIDRYWRTWNMPVHNWITRHLYFPLLRADCSKFTATFVVFIFSALMHELVISVPFQHVYFYAFLGMLAQAPMIFISKYMDRILDNSFLGNALFWCSFCIVGQPMGLYLYYYDLHKLSMGGAPPQTV